MITPIINFRHKSNSSSKVQPYRPFFRFNKISDSYSFKGSVGYIDSENSRNLDTLSRAYKEVMALLELKTDEGIKKVENDVPNLKLWKGITFSNFGDEKKSVYLNIPQSKKAGNVIKFVLSDKKTKKEKTYLIKDFSMVIKDPSVKSPSEFEYLSNAEIERYGINKDLKNLLEDLDPLILKLRIAVQKRSEQDLKPPTAILDEKLSQKLRNIKLLNSEVDSIFETKSKRTLTRLKDNFGDYNGITGQTAHMFKNVGPDNLKIVCSTVQNIDHGEMMRLLVFNSDDEIVSGYLFKDFDKVVSNYNPKYIAVIPEKLNFVNVNEIGDDKYSKELPALIDLAESKLKSFRNHLLAPPPAPKNTGLLPSNDVELLASIDKNICEINECFEGLPYIRTYRIKESYPKLELAAGKKGFTFIIEPHNGENLKKISILPVQNRFNSNLTRLSVTDENGQLEKIFLIKDNNKIVKNYNPDYPKVVPEVLKFYDEDEIKTLDISRDIQDLANEISEYQQYVQQQSVEPTKLKKTRVKSSLGSKTDSSKQLHVTNGDLSKIKQKSFRLLVKSCSEDFLNALNALNEKPDEFKSVMADIQKRVDAYLSKDS